VFIPFLWLIVLIGSTPVILWFDGPVARGLVAAATATAMAMVGIQMRPGEGDHLAKLVGRWTPVAAVPALWMVLQVVPIPLPGLAHPIWTGAAAALNGPVAGTISIDPGLTLLALGRYLFALGIGFVATAIAIDRERAQWTLFALVGVTTVLSALLIAIGRGGLAGGAEYATANAIAALGVIASAAATFHAAEKLEMLRDKTGAATARAAAVLGACALAWAICGYAVIHASPKQVLFAASCGLAVLGLIVAVRRAGIGVRIATVVAAGGLVAAVGIAAGGVRGDPFLRFAVDEPLAAIERMLADAGMAGSGGGTFSALLPVYATVADITAGATAPTAAAAAALEFGRPMWGLLVVIAIAIAGGLFRAAMQRGRDWCYAGAAASCVITIVVESFVDVTFFATAVMLVASVVIGLGLAQSASRTVR
jgi:hypothetical protein